MDLSLGPLSGSQPYVASLPVARLTGVEIALWGMSLALILRLTIFARSRSLSDYAVVDNYAVVQIGIVFGCMLLAVLSATTNRFTFKPDPATILEPGMTMLFMTDVEGVDRVRAALRA